MKNAKPYLALLRRGVCLFLCSLAACRPDPQATPPTQPADTEKEMPIDVLVFPETLKTDDQTVNDFVDQAMKHCASGDYERFRLLWSAKEEPLSRQEYDEGWKAVQKITVQAMQKIVLAPEARNATDDGETAYVVLADVDLDPTLRAGRTEPHRQVVLLVRRESHRWCLARAPKEVRNWLQKQTEQEKDLDEKKSPSTSITKPD